MTGLRTMRPNAFAAKIVRRQRLIRWALRGDAARFPNSGSLIAAMSRGIGFVVRRGLGSLRSQVVLLHNGVRG